MNKKKILVSLLCASASVGLLSSVTSCSTEDNTPIVEEQKFTVTFDSKGGSAVTEQSITKDQKASKPNNPTRAGYVFVGWYKNSECTDGQEFNFETTTITSHITLYAKWEVAEVEYTVTFKLNNNENDVVVKATKDAQDNNFYVDEPEAPTKKHHTFDYWCTDEALTTAYNFSDPVTSDLTLYAKYKVSYDTVNSIFDFVAEAKKIDPNATGNVTIAETTTFGRFTVEGGKTRFEVGNKALNTQGASIFFELKGADNQNTITMTGTSASSSKNTLEVVNLDTNTVVHTIADMENKQAFDAVTIANLPAGKYEIRSNASIRFTGLSLSEKLPQGDTTGIILDTTSVSKDFLLGRDFSSIGLNVLLDYENGRKDAIGLDNTNLTITTEDFSTAGVKKVTVTYKFDENTTYEATYEVNVCQISEVVLYNYTYSSGNTLALKTIYKLNDSLDTSNLVVKAKCLLPGETDKYIEFILESSEYNIVAPELTSTGNKDVTIKYLRDETKVETYSIEIVSVPTISDSITVTVDPAGAITTGDVNNFKTINQALQFLELCNLENEVVKNIILKQNTTYFEKVDITLPNVVLTTEKDQGAETVTNPAVIEFNVIAGQLDPSEKNIYSTDGSATVSIRSSATGFNASFVTFKHSNNTFEKYTESLKISKDSQAVAVLVQADQSVFKNVTFSSYHDTLYAQVGRQYYENCYIEGHTDYIFGYNATAYFKNCTIKTLGAGEAEKNGGYVVATKGHNKGATTDAVTYGYIFDNCDFTADNNTMPGSVSLGRGWDVSMKMMVMNSTISGHFSKEAYGQITEGDKDLNDRYTKMDAAPNASGILEYNNTGDGAITASLDATCTVLNATEAAPYGNLAVVFNHSNGLNTYSENWAATQQTDVTITLMNGAEEIGKIYEWSGNTIIENNCIAPAVSGKIFDGWYTDSACTTAYDFGTKLTANQSLVLYAKYNDVSSDRVTFNANSLNGDESYNIGNTIFTSALFDLLLTAGGTVKAISTVSPAIADDGLTFNKALLPNGGSRVFSVTAKANMSVTIYFTISNGDIASKDTEKSGALTVNGEKVTDETNKSSKIAYSYTIDVTANQTITLSASSNRLILFGLVATPKN